MRSVAVRMRCGRNWNRTAAVYNAGMKALFLPFGGERRVKMGFLAFAELSEGMAVLDICCATGFLTRLASAAVGEAGLTIGVDKSPRMIARAKTVPNGATFVCADAGALPFASGSFDRVLAFLALHELDTATLDAAIEEAHRVIKPHGLLVAGEYPINPTGLKGALVRGVMKAFEPPAAAAVIEGEHLRAIGSLFAIEQRAIILSGLGEVTTARKLA